MRQLYGSSENIYMTRQYKYKVWVVHDEILNYYPPIFRPFYPKNGKIDVSTKLCDYSQAINLV